MRASIIGLGEWFPDRIRENGEWPPEFVEASRRRQGDRTLVDIPSGDDDDPHRIAARHLRREAQDPFLGSTRRRVADENTGACEAETFAARAALADAGVRPEEVDSILSWAAVVDRMVPSSASRVSHALEAKRAVCMGVDAACSSPVAQLLFATSMIEAGRARVVLLTQSHMMTRAFPMMHPASPNIGDGASAFVVAASERPGVRTIHAVTEGQYYDAVTWCRGKTPATDPPWWQPGPGHYLGSHDSRAAQALMQDTVGIGARTVRELMERARMPLTEVNVLASVQPRGWVPMAIAEALGLPPSIAPSTFDEYAHLGGCGVIVNLLAARKDGRLKEGSRVVWYAQGAGFTRSAALLEW